MLEQLKNAVSKESCPVRPIPTYKAGLYGLTETRQLSNPNATPAFIPVHRTGFSAYLNKIDKGLVEQWVRDLVIVKTFVGLRFQEAILKKVAEKNKCSFRLASPKEEAQGIDGYIGEKPVSIKPDTYKLKKGLSEDIQVSIIYYSKEKSGIAIEYEDI